MYKEGEILQYLRMRGSIINKDVMCVLELQTDFNANSPLFIDRPEDVYIVVQDSEDPLQLHLPFTEMYITEENEIIMGLSEELLLYIVNMVNQYDVFCVYKEGYICQEI